MSEGPHSSEMTCWSCQANPATEQFTYGGHETCVCTRCLQWLQARDELEGILRDAIISGDQENTDDLLTRLDMFLQINQHLDTGGEFARKIAHHRAMALVDTGRYAEAEVACAAWGNLGFANVWERWEHGYETARTLVALKRPEQALLVLEDALDHRDSYFLGIAEKLILLAELAQTLGKEIKPEHVELARNAADAYGVELSSNDGSIQMILTLAKTIGDKLPLAALKREQGIKDAV